MNTATFSTWPRSIRIGKYALKVASITFCIMCAFELATMVVSAKTNLWISQFSTVLFVAFLAAAVSSVDHLRGERLRFEAASAEERYRTLFESSLAGAYRTALDGRIIDCNVSFCRMFGYASREEVIGNFVQIGYIDPNDRTQFLEKLKVDKNVTNFEQRLRRKDGSIIWVLNSATLLTSQDGTETSLRGTLTDITDLRNAEQQNRRLAAIVGESENAIISKSLNGTIETWNGGAERIYGYRADEVIGKSIDLIAPSSRTGEFRKILEQIKNGHDVRDFETIRVKKDGNEIAVHLSVSPIKDANGMVIGASTIAHDITDRWRAEELLRKSEEQYRLLFASNPIPMWVFDRKTLSFLAVNKAAELKYGFSQQEFLSMTLNDIRSENEVPDLLEHMAKSADGLQKAEIWRHRKKNGEDITVEIVCHNLDVQGADAMLVAANDVTERECAAQLLQDSESKYRVLFEDSADACLLMDGKGFVDCNSAALEMFGFSHKSEFRHPADISPPSQPDGTSSRAAAEEKIASALLNGKACFDWVHLRKNGEVFPAEVYLSALTLGGQPMLMATVRDSTGRKQAEEALSIKTTLLEAQSETTLDGILVVDESDHIILANKQFALHFGIPDDMMATRDDLAVRAFVMDQVEDPDSFMARIRYISAHLDARSRDEVRLKNGKEIDRYSAPLVDSSGLRRGRIWYFRDITERKIAESALRRAEEKYRAIFEDSVIGIFQISPEGRPVSVNRALARLHGYGSPGEFLAEVHNVPEQLFVDPRRMIEVAQTADKEGVVRDVEIEVYCKDRSKKWVRLNQRAVRDSSNDIQHYEGTLEDITERKAAEQRAHFLAFYDALTELPNRTLLEDRLTNALSAARRRKEKVALLFVGLDRFKSVNDSFGRSIGDAALREVAKRLGGCIREHDTLARMDSDEFLIMLSDMASVAGVAVAADRVMTSMKAEFVVDGHSLGMSCSVGISVFPDHGKDVNILIKNAEAAMYSAKEAGRNNVRFFADEMNAEAAERSALANDLRLALDRKEFFLVYQPQMEIVTGSISGYEALIRWRHPKLNLVPPDKFIPIAEDNGLILPVGEWVLRTACGQAKEWLSAGLKPVPVAVNVSAVQFRQESFVGLVKRVLQETGLPPEYLELELTESLLLTNFDSMVTVLAELKDLGVKLAIDDFGTGYSSLSYLKQFPVNKLKIDQSFIRDIATETDDASITAAIISIAKSLNLKVIAEGVENEAQMSFLREHRCDEIQGYIFSRPISAADVYDKLLSLHRPICPPICRHSHFGDAPELNTEACSSAV
jgi:diguanylate cyclase (GGDEF)-like protein/PAS domain S-box-containing protein